MRKNIRVTLAISLALILLLALAPSVLAKRGVHESHSSGGNGASQSALVPGWDVSTGWPLAKGKVVWNQPDATGTFQVTYILEGATPNHTYQVGIHLFPTIDPQWYEFGTGFEHHPIGGTYVPNILRDSIVSDVSASEFGFLTTDEFGNGAEHFNMYPKTGTYSIQFTVRVGNCFSGDMTGCSVVFRTPAPFASGVEVTIP